jgi:hypothetical protein
MRRRRSRQLKVESGARTVNVGLALVRCAGAVRIVELVKSGGGPPHSIQGRAALGMRRRIGSRRLSRWTGGVAADGGLGFGGTIIGVGVVHVAAEEFVLCADDDSLSCRSSADDVSAGCECIPLQLAGMPDGVLDGEGVLPDRRRR